MKKILFFVTEDSFFVSHRLELAQSVAKAGYRVAVVTRCNKHKDIIEKAGIELFMLKHFKRLSFNFFREFLTFFELYKIVKAYKPELMHNVAIKPVIYGTIIAKLCGVPYIINALAGLGYLFTVNNNQKKFNLKKIFLQQLVKRIFKFIFHSKNTWVLLQNQDDRDVLLTAGRINNERVRIIPGSGINVDAYKVTTTSLETSKRKESISAITSTTSEATVVVKIAMVSRMLKDKGVLELIDAIIILRKKNLIFEVHLYGSEDKENPTSILREQLLAWQKANLIIWHGFSDDINGIYANCHIAVLPSYREGLPRTLLEALACGKPIVTTNVPGCKELVRNNFNGILVPARDSIALANALEELILAKDKRESMGKNGREMVEQLFSNNVIHKEVLKLYAAVFSSGISHITNNADPLPRGDLL